MGQLLDEAQIRTFWSSYYRQGVVKVAADEAGLSGKHGRDIARGLVQRANMIKERMVSEEGLVRGVVDRTALRPEAKKALDDYGYFRQRYWGHVSRPWQTNLADHIVRIFDSADAPEDEFGRHYLVANMPPGGGKTTNLRDICSWLIARDRSVRILWGSRTEGQSQDNVRLIRDALGSPIPLFVSEQDKRRRGAIDPTGCLADDYGTFKPPRGGQWDSKSFTVSLPGDAIGSNKENTMAAYGQDSGFLGGRYDLSVWDDLVDIKNYRTEDARDKLRVWWDSQAESRVEPGGLVVLLGQRLSPDDLYRYCLDKVAVVFDEAGDEVYRPDVKKYVHIKYPAHDDALCQNIHAPKVAKPWPEGCLLDPSAITWQMIRTEQSNNDSNYRITFQQEDIDPDSALVKRVWIDGGQDTDGVVYHGCWDEQRAPFTRPRKPGTFWSVVTVDPSGVKNWAVQWWAVNHQSGDRFLIAAHNEPMYANELLDNNPSGGFTGLLEDWWQIGMRIGLRIGMTVIENNTTQRWLKDFDHFKRWTRSRQVLNVAHATNKSTKLDPDKGVSILRTPFKHGLIRLPGTVEGRQMCAPLVREVTHYPYGTTTDMVMAAWFMEHWLPIHGRPQSSNVTPLHRPSWARGADRPNTSRRPSWAGRSSA